VHDEAELVEVDEELEQSVRWPRHLHEKLILEILGDFRVFETVRVSDGLQYGDFVFVVEMELCFVLVQEGARFRVKLLQHHVEVKADEYGE